MSGALRLIIPSEKDMNIEQIMKNIRAFVLVVDRDMNIVYSNREDSRKHLENSPLTDVVRRAFETRKPFDATETHMSMPKLHSAGLREVDVCVKGEFAVVDGKEYVVLTITDITLQNKERSDMRETISEARNEAATHASFLANMSHEIRTPLSAILGFSKLLTQTSDPVRQKKYCSIIESNTQLLQQLVNDILDITKIESGTLKYDFKRVNLNEIFEAVRNTVKIHVQPETVLNMVLGMPDFEIVTDPERLSQVLINMLTNACKFTRRGAITFGYELTDVGDVYFYVRDTGKGISPEDQTNLFKRFVTRGREKESVGLGLAICKNIVTTMGGKIGVGSAGEGRGSTFWFTLPTNRREGEVDASSDEFLVGTEAPAPVAKESDKPVILVAEDNDSNYLLFESILEEDYTLCHAVDGREALDMVETVRPDLILMDISMPRMDGYEATRLIRKTDTKIPIIAVTAYAFASDKDRILKTGFNSHITKPINADRLTAEIERHLN